MAGRRKLALRLESCDSPYSPQVTGHGTSPMTALSNIMVGLSCVGSTPRRKLSLSEVGDTPTDPLSRNSSQSSGISVSSPNPEDSQVGDFFPARLSNSEAENVRRNKQALRRLNSTPSSFDSPLFSQSPKSTKTVTSPWKPKKLLPLESPCEEEELVFFDLKANSENESNHSEVPQEESNGPSTSFTTIKPLPQDDFRIPRPISAPANLLNQGKAASMTAEEDDSVQLQHSRLTSSNDDEDDNDDGFFDIFNSDSQGKSPEKPQGFNGLLNNPIIVGGQQPSPPQIDNVLTSPPAMPLQNVDCNSMDITPEPKCRRGIFKIPSQPVLKRASSFLKRPERPKDSPSPIMKKKARSISVASPNPQADVRRIAKLQQKKCLVRSFSTADADQCKMRIEHKLSRDAEGLNLTGDGVQSHLLPLINGCHKELKTITPETLARVIGKEYSDDVEEFFIVDARYPYEYIGGHIKGAINLYTKDAINKFFLNHPMQKLDKRRLVIFHCEFSSQRAPSLLKHLRENDRNANLENYPALFYPELYLLHGGYKNFFESCKGKILVFMLLLVSYY
ncbi:putative M-phase inducer phosphatase [Apostichopus japonicus]|uniref:M-phase inducer phosphatase n=1 Tax=Stichopus japonicus TaxID=307972 RepID=A0A2G8L5L5_STIJA|nr:putative M-phase inducer phosphatase [Apostichopus japonicus]